ncbi:hypothetical protein OAB00_00110 [Akkermansiaceae bacterium]|nr:hypothetical protein [Akkermansiaceae bacterium]
MTDTITELQIELARTGRLTLPVNIIYPADYPNSKAVLLESTISPNDAIEAMEKALSSSAK